MPARDLLLSPAPGRATWTCGDHCSGAACREISGGLLGTVRRNGPQELDYQLLMDTRSTPYRAVLCPAGTIRRKTVRLHILSCAALLVSVPASANDCTLMRLIFASNSAATGSVTVTIEDEASDLPYSADNPQVWTGPVKISLHGQPACTAGKSVSIVENPVLLGRDVLYVSTYSGSDRIMYGLDTRTCRIVWKSPVFYGGASYTHGVLILGKRRVPLNNKCRPWL
jgi:hypothetical protein